MKNLGVSGLSRETCSELRTAFGPRFIPFSSSLYRCASVVLESVAYRRQTEEMDHRGTQEGSEGLTRVVAGDALRTENRVGSEVPSRGVGQRDRQDTDGLLKTVPGTHRYVVTSKGGARSPRPYLLHGKQMWTS